MHVAENTALVIVVDANIVEQLQPECLQLVSIVLEKVEVVAHCRKDLIKVLLELTTVFLSFHLFLGAWKCRSLTPL